MYNFIIFIIFFNLLIVKKVTHKAKQQKQNKNRLVPLATNFAATKPNRGFETGNVCIASTPHQTAIQWLYTWIKNLHLPFVTNKNFKLLKSL